MEFNDKVKDSRKTCETIIDIDNELGFQKNLRDFEK